MNSKKAVLFLGASLFTATTVALFFSMKGKSCSETKSFFVVSEGFVDSVRENYEYHKKIYLEAFNKKALERLGAGSNPTVQDYFDVHNEATEILSDVWINDFDEGSLSYFNDLDDEIIEILKDGLEEFPEDLKKIEKSAAFRKLFRAFAYDKKKIEYEKILLQKGRHQFNDYLVREFYKNNQGLEHLKEIMETLLSPWFYELKFLEDSISSPFFEELALVVLEELILDLKRFYDSNSMFDLENYIKTRFSFLKNTTKGRKAIIRDIKKFKKFHAFYIKDSIDEALEKFAKIHLKRMSPKQTWKVQSKIGKTYTLAEIDPFSYNGKDRCFDYYHAKIYSRAFAPILPEFGIKKYLKEHSIKLKEQKWNGELNPENRETITNIIKNNKAELVRYAQEFFFKKFINTDSELCMLHKHGGLAVFVLFEKDEPVGFAFFTNSIVLNNKPFQLEPGTIFLKLAVIDPDSQKQGLGRHLTFSILKKYPKTKKIKLLIRVEKDLVTGEQKNKDVCQIYEKFGFKPYVEDKLRYNTIETQFFVWNKQENSSESVS